MVKKIQLIPHANVSDKQRIQMYVHVNGHANTCLPVKSAAVK
jgi:hypothetical protein